LVKVAGLSNGCFRASLDATSGIKFRTVSGAGEHSAVDDFNERCVSETEANSGAILEALKSAVCPADGENQNDGKLTQTLGHLW
jgi:hypothetical protein